MILPKKKNLRNFSIQVTKADVKEIVDTDVKKGNRWISILVTRSDRVVLITDLEKERILGKVSLLQRLKNLFS